MTKRCCFAAIAILLIGTTVSILAFVLADRFSYVLGEHYYQEKAASRVEDLTNELEHRLTLVTDFARSQQPYTKFSTLDEYEESQRQFRQLAKPLLEHKGIASADWAPFVRWGDREQFESRLQAILGKNQFRFKRLTPLWRMRSGAGGSQNTVAKTDGSKGTQSTRPGRVNGTMPLDDLRRQALFPVLLTSHPARNGMRGLHRYMPAAVKKGSTLLVGGRRFYPRQGTRSGILIPVKRRADDGQQLAGVVSVAFEKNLLGISRASGDPQPVRIRIKDVTNPGKANLIASEFPRERSADEITSSQVKIAEQKFQVDCQRNPNYDFRPSWLPWTAFFGSLAATGLLAGVWTVRENRRLELRNSNLKREVDERKEMQRFLQSLLEFREQERELVAHEIHDGFVQEVVGAQMFVQAISARIDKEDHSCQRDLAMASQLLAKAIEEGRRMISDLKPSVVDELGLLKAIKKSVNEEAETFGLSITFRHSAGFRRLPSMVERTLYRIVQESLTNVKRHSGVYEATVTLAQSDRSVLLEVKDLGCGFDVSRIEDGRFGVRGIQERARLLQGTATISSSPAQGTCVSVEIPLEGPAVSPVPLGSRRRLVAEVGAGIESPTGDASVDTKSPTDSPTVN